MNVYHRAVANPYRDPGSRMTDGLHSQSRMLGDVKFHAHRRIDPAVVERSREGLAEDSLGTPTWELAASLGYPRLGGARQRIEPRPRLAPPPQLSFAQERLWFFDQLCSRGARPSTSLSR